ncbi:MAG: sulfatase [Alphaproteobacteria bacterium]|nr:sulfatase [Alphaproteobacteria bacterium]
MLLALLLTACTPAPAPAPPDVLVVVLDTVRADRLSTYGHSRPTSPQLDAIAQAGVRFAEAVSSSAWTWPSHATLFTGEPPWVHGAHWPADPETAGAFPLPRAELPTFAERFAAAGYRTASVSSNCLLDPEMGLTRGFQEASCQVVPGETEARAGALMAEDDGRPLLLFVNLMYAHSPYELTPARWAQAHAAELEEAGAPEWLRPYLIPGGGGVDLFRRETPESRTGVQRYLAGELPLGEAELDLLRDLYDGEIWLQDRQLNKLLRAWTARAPDGVVLVTSDHGEHFGEHGHIAHRSSVFPGVTDVPLVVAAPGRLPAGLVVDTPVQLERVSPLLLALAGLEPDEALLTGITENTLPATPILSSAWPDAYRAKAVGGRYAETWRLYRVGEEALVYSSGGAAQLYDLAADPEMREDIAEARPERVQALLAEAKAAFGEEQGSGAAAAPEGERLEGLRALGYLE